MEAGRDAEAGITSDVRVVGTSGSTAVAGSIQYDIHGLARDSPSGKSNNKGIPRVWWLVDLAQVRALVDPSAGLLVSSRCSPTFSSYVLDMRGQPERPSNHLATHHTPVVVASHPAVTPIAKIKKLLLSRRLQAG